MVLGCCAALMLALLVCRLKRFLCAVIDFLLLVVVGDSGYEARLIVLISTDSLSPDPCSSSLFCYGGAWSPRGPDCN